MPFIFQCCKDCYIQHLQSITSMWKKANNYNLIVHYSFNYGKHKVQTITIKE